MTTRAGFLKNFKPASRCFIAIKVKYGWRVLYVPFYNVPSYHPEVKRGTQSFERTYLQIVSCIEEQGSYVLKNTLNDPLFVVVPID